MNISTSYSRLSLALRFILQRPKRNCRRKSRAFLDLKNAQNGNYYFDLVQHLLSLDYAVYIKFDPRFLYAHTKYFSHLLQNKLVSTYFSNNHITSEDLYFVDHTYPEVKSQKSIRIAYDSFLPDVDYDIQFPMGISPVHYIENTIAGLNDLRRTDKRMRVFFSGNCNRHAYDHPIFQDHFDMPNRWECVQVLLEQMESTGELIVNDTTLHRDKVNLRLWNWSPTQSENLDKRVSNESWFHQLAQSDFFLGLPGVRMPLCYNVVEAMSVGAIPILAYGHFFDPPLKDMFNCVIYRTEEELVSKTRYVLNMDQNEVSELRNRVLEYYDTHHMSGNVIRKILAMDKSAITMKMYCENQSLLASGLEI